MAGTARRFGKLGGVVALALLTLVPSSGCLSFVHPVAPPPPEEVFPCPELPPATKNRVYVFFIHGLDPFDLSNFTGVHDYVQSLGFIKTYFGLPFHIYHLEKELRKVHREDPDARFVLIGFSYGAGLARDLACSVRDEGIQIDLIVYLDGVRGAFRKLNRPSNVARVVNVLAFDRNDSANVTDGENYRVDDVWHFGTPSHPQTLRLLGRELGAVAEQVTVVRYHPAPLPGEPGQVEHVPGVRVSSEWGFLRPDANATGAPGRAPAAEAWGSEPATMKPR